MTSTQSITNEKEAPMTRPFIEPIGQLRPGALGAAEIAELVWKFVYVRGRSQVSMDNGGSVYVMPADHQFSRAMLAQHADRIVGTYTADATAEDICGDLIEQWRTDREAAA
jgi:hypothetical protein